MIESIEEECMESFPDIESMTIERFYDNYKKTNGLEIHNIVRLGVYSVDIKNRIKFLTDDPNDAENHHRVLRGQTHKR